MGPVVCVITDRTRGGEDALVERVHAAARAGAHLIQVRERDLDARPLLRLVTRCLQAVARTGARVLVNDRVDVALAAGAHGVHLRSDSPPASRVRTIVPPGFVIGRSVHGKAEARRATADGGVDYLMFGSCFPSASKPGRDAAGVAALAEIVIATLFPVLAVGGVTLERLAQVRHAGAAGFAAIGLFDTPPEALPLVLSRSVEAFGSSAGIGHRSDR